ncbi:glycosyltransferase [Agrococcus terreus]|nr:glycosyltransferase [Agrococcus terreus]
MKPQIAGRIRRNILTLLELGFEVTVVNSTPRPDFFQGLEHPRLSADFVEVRSLAVRYQARMTRKKDERQARWEREKERRAQSLRAPAPDAPGWMKGELPCAETIYRAWTSKRVRQVRKEFDAARRKADRRATKLLRSTRRKRDLTIRDQLKQIHLVNRFVEFWRLSPDRIAEHRPDLVVSSDLPGLVGASIAARRLGVPHLHDCHELYLESTTLRPFEKKVLEPVEKAYMRRADAVVVVNETIRDEYERRYGVRGTVLRNAAPAVPEKVRADPVDLRARAGIPESSNVVLYQGGLVPGRGLDVCVRAATGFADGVHLILIGRGKSLDELTALAHELRVTDRVHFLPAVEPAELPAYTAAADVGVIPYQPVSRNNEYALPNKVFEYTGAGIPFVAADLRELRRVATTARCGEVYDPFDSEALAAAVGAVLDGDAYSTYRRNAVAFGRENTWETERTILVSEIERLTARG